MKKTYYQKLREQVKEDIEAWSYWFDENGDPSFKTQFFMIIIVTAISFF